MKYKKLVYIYIYLEVRRLQMRSLPNGMKWEVRSINYKLMLVLLVNKK